MESWPVTDKLSWLTLLSFGDQGWGDELARGAGLSLSVAALAYAFGLLFGLLGAGAKLSGNRFARSIAQVYTTIVRAVPEILVILLVYYSATSAVRNAVQWVFPSANFDMNALTAAAISLGVVQGAYSTEVFRGAIQAVDRGQSEAARSLGLSRLQVFLSVTGPQMLRFALPGLGNLWLVVLKETSLISIIGLSELLLTGKMAAGTTHSYFFFFSVVGLIYLAMSGVSAAAFSLAELRFSRPWQR